MNITPTHTRKRGGCGRGKVMAQVIGRSNGYVSYYASYRQGRETVTRVTTVSEERFDRCFKEVA